MKTKNGDFLAWVRRGSVLVGAMDFCTGLALVFAPALTLKLMRLAGPGIEAMVFLRWVGAFVGAVGATYLLAAWNGTEERLRSALVFTTVFRLAAGSYAASAILSGALGAGWGSVPLTDLGLVAVQVWVLLRGRDWSA